MEGYMHGINLGGWFSQCDNTEKRYDNFIKKEDFRRIARWGLDHVRIPVDYNLVQHSDGSFNERGFERLCSCILWCRQYGLNMILDLHKTIGYSFDNGENEQGFFDSAVYQEYFYDLWEEFAKRFGGYDNVAFELLNEITLKEYCGSWNRIAAEAVRRIRMHAPATKIIIGGYYYNDVSAVKDLDPPADENVVYSFHCYSPHIFTHQGAYWMENMDTEFRMPFDSSIDDYIRYTRQYIGGEEHVDEYDTGEERITPLYFERSFAEAIAVAKKRNTELYCGEYGVIDLADCEDSLRWLECISSVFDSHGIGRALWSYKEMDFGLVDAHYDDVREQIIELL